MTGSDDLDKRGSKFTSVDNEESRESSAVEAPIHSDADMGATDDSDAVSEPSSEDTSEFVALDALTIPDFRQSILNANTLLAGIDWNLTLPGPNMSDFISSLPAISDMNFSQQLSELVNSMQPMLSGVDLQLGEFAQQLMKSSLGGVDFQLGEFAQQLTTPALGSIDVQWREWAQQLESSVFGDTERQWAEMTQNLLPSNFAGIDQSDIMSQWFADLNFQFAESARKTLGFVTYEFDQYVRSTLLSIDFDAILKGYKPAMVKAFNDVQLWPTPSMSAEIQYEVAEHAMKGDIPSLRLVLWNYYERNNHAHLREAVESWWDDAEYRARKQIIKHALRSHELRLYGASIPTLISQIEGIASAQIYHSRSESSIVVGPSVKLGKTNAVVKFAVAAPPDSSSSTNFMFAVMWESVTHNIENVSYAFQDFFNEYDAVRNSQDINRHSILHGMQINHPSYLNSMRCILLLDALHGIRKVQNSPSRSDHGYDQPEALH